MRKTTARQWPATSIAILSVVAVSVGGVWLVTASIDGRTGDEASLDRRGSPASIADQCDRSGSGARPLEIVETGGDFRLVRHAMGASRVPLHPQRLCGLAYLDELTSIGARLTAASCSSNGRFPDYLEEHLQGVVGIARGVGGTQPDYETLVTVEPDLIISADPDAQSYRQLSKIAPVVVLTDYGQNARQRLLDLGVLLGRRRQAEARQAWYDAKVKAAREVLRDKVGDRKVVFFRVFGKQYYIHGHTRAGIVLYDELGLNPPELIESSPRGFMLSPEALLELDADYVFVATERTKGSYRTWQELLDHPAWQRVPAVRSGRVYWLEDRHHWLVLGILAKSRVIDEVLQTIAPESLDAVNRRAESVLKGEGP